MLKGIRFGQSGGAVPPSSRQDRRAGWFFLGGILFGIAGCAAPETVIRDLNDRNRVISRGIADVVDAVDRAFGEPRIGERERLVALRFGPAVGAREGQGVKLTFPVALRLPLPALERMANIFLEIESFTDKYSEFSGIASGLNENKSLTGTILTKLAETTHAGVRLDVYWKHGPNVGVRPFLRFRWRPEPFQLLAEQQFYARTGDWLGGRTILQADRILDEDSFLRFLTTMEYNMKTPGVDLEHAILYRRPFYWWQAVLSLDLGVKYNPYHGDPETRDRDSEEDSDQGYVQMRVVGRLPLTWVEYEIKPGYYYLWRHEKKGEFAVIFYLRFIFESFLRPGW